MFFRWIIFILICQLLAANVFAVEVAPELSPSRLVLSQSFVSEELKDRVHDLLQVYNGADADFLGSFKLEDNSGKTVFDFIKEQDPTIADILENIPLDNGWFQKKMVEIRATIKEKSAISLHDENLSELLIVARNFVTILEKVRCSDPSFKLIKDEFKDSLEEVEEAHGDEDLIILPKSEEFDLAALADVVGTKGYLKKKIKPAVELRVVLGRDVTKIKTDSRKLLRILMNLLINSLTLTKEGTVLLRITSQGEFLLFEVLDTGSGMSDAMIKKLLEGEAFTSGDHKGIGIGMINVRRMLSALGSKLSIESKIDRGSKFSFLLPAS